MDLFASTTYGGQFYGSRAPFEDDPFNPYPVSPSQQFRPGPPSTFSSPPLKKDPSDTDFFMMSADLLGGAPLPPMSPIDRAQFADGFPFKAKYIGTIEVPQPRGLPMVASAVTRIRQISKSVKESKLKVIIVASSTGIRIVDQESGALRDTFSLDKISFTCVHPKEKKVFAFISASDTVSPPVFKCHVYKSEKKAYLITERIGQCFTVAMEHHREQKAATMRKKVPPSSSSSSRGPRHSVLRNHSSSYAEIVAELKRRMAQYPLSHDDSAYFSYAFQELDAIFRALDTADVYT